jgi:hypothetical protein
MEWHPFAERFGWIEEKDWPAFLESIRATGGNEQPVYYRVVGGERQGLDGRNRERACEFLGLPCKAVEVKVPDDEVKAFIVRHNIHRRHLSAEARRDIVADLRADGMSLRKIGETVGVSATTVVRDLSPGVTHVTPETAPDATRPGVTHVTPATVNGRDGKQYPASRPKPAGRKKPEPPPVLKDAEGVVIPDRLRDLWADDFLQQSLNDVMAWHEPMNLAPVLAGVRKRIAHMVWLRSLDLIRQLEEADLQLELAKETISQALFYAVCPRCEGRGDGCTDCRHSGYLPQWRWQELHGEGRQ